MSFSPLHYFHEQSSFHCLDIYGVVVCDPKTTTIRPIPITERFHSLTFVKRFSGGYVLHVY